MATDETNPQTPPYHTMQALLVASMARPAIAQSGNGVSIFEFADPRFHRFLIRKNHRDAILNQTTSLTPVDHIFHGPNTGSPLFKGNDCKTDNFQKGSLSIILKQAGDTFASLVEGNKQEEVIERTLAHPELFEMLFRSVAFVGAFEKTHSRDDSTRRLDLNMSNIMFDMETSAWGIIDQMSPEDIVHHKHTTLNLVKAHKSVDRLLANFSSLIRALNNDNISSNNPSLLLDLANDNANKMHSILSAAEAQPNLDAQLAYLQTHLSDPNTEKWRGVEPVFHENIYDETRDKPVFGGVTKTTAVPLDMKTATAQELLDGLNEMADKTLAKTR